MVSEPGSVPLVDKQTREELQIVDLVYVSDTAPGIRRQRKGDSFRYVGIDGREVRDSQTLSRIKSLAVPPAWTDVWISPLANGHLQATGRDAKQRKQYRYHKLWRAVRDADKYEHTIDFGEALPKIRQRVEEDMRLRGLPKEKVTATVIQLLETTLIRVGNEEYARANDSYGLSTMRDQHAKVEGNTLRFEFRGKSGKLHSLTIRDRRLARIVKQCQEIEGQELFQYLDEEGKRQRIGSSDVNAYLKEATGKDYTAKDFRTWAGTVMAALALKDLGFESEAEARRNVTSAVEMVSKQLGNTPAVCRACYVHPDVLDSYREGSLGAALRRPVVLTPRPPGLSAEEQMVLSFLKRRRRERRFALAEAVRA